MPLSRANIRIAVPGRPAHQLKTQVLNLGSGSAGSANSARTPPDSDNQAQGSRTGDPDIRRGDLRASEIIHGMRACLRRLEPSLQPLEVRRLAEETIPSDHAEELVGFAVHPSAVAVAMRYPPAGSRLPTGRCGHRSQHRHDLRLCRGDGQ